MNHMAKGRRSFGFALFSFLFVPYLLSSGACHRGPRRTEELPTMTEEPQSAPVSTEELDFHFRALLDPSGDGPSRRQHDASVHYLLVHSDQSYPILLNALRTNPTALNAPAIIEILPFFKRSDSVPILEEIMQRGAEQVSEVAGVALGRHPAPAAREALMRGLNASSPETVIAAIDGLMFRADNSACSSLKRFFGSSDVIVREHALRAAVNLGCMTEKEAARLRKLAH
jgi:hypothetical protein